MEKQYFTILQLFWNKLKNNIIRERKKISNNSVLWTLVEIQSKEAEKLLRESSYTSAQFSPEELTILEREHYIRFLNVSKNEYIITAKGIWEIEKKEYGFTEENLLEFLQNKFLNFDKQSKPLDDKEKLAIFALISLRNFTLETSMDLSNQLYRDRWTPIFESIFNFLNENNLFTKKYSNSDKFFFSSGSEHHVQYFMRHRNNLAIKSNQIYESPGNSKYYLDIGENWNLSKLKHSFLLVFKSIDSFDVANLISNTCIRLANENAKYVRKDSKFIDANHDELIKKVLKQIYVDSPSENFST